MVGRSTKNDIKSRLGKRSLGRGKPKTAQIRDARDVLQQKGSVKGRIGKLSKVQSTSKRPHPATSLNTKTRVRRLMPIKEILGKSKPVKHTDSLSKSSIRTLSLSSGSLRITTQRPELSRKAIVSSRSLKIVTPSKRIATTDATESRTSPRRTLRNDLYTSRLSHAVEDDLRTSSPSLSFTSLTEERPSLFNTRPETTSYIQNVFIEEEKLTKIVITNLHPRVIQADISELFGAVGPLASVKLENCVAEVLFLKAVDANNAYRKYHNRMLDGQPMKCTLGIASPVVEKTNEGTSINYSGAELVYPATSTRPVVFQVRI